MSRWAEFITKLLGAAKQGAEKPVRPATVDEALSHDYGDVQEWRARGGGMAPPDAPHIPDDETI